MYAYHNNHNNNVVIDSIDAIIQGHYNPWNNAFSNDCNSFLKKKYGHNELLTDIEVESLIKKMVKGKTKSLIGNYYSQNIGALDILTQKHKLSEKQVTAVLSCMKQVGKDLFKWVDNLILLGYELAIEQRDKLILLGYKAGVDLILKKDVADITDLNSICNTADNNLDKIKYFFSKFGIIPDQSTLDILIARAKSLGDNNYTKAFIVLLIDHGLVPDIQTIVKLSDCMYLDTINKHIVKIFEEKLIKSLSDLSQIFCVPHTLIKLSNIKYVLSLATKFGVPLDPQVLQNLSLCITSSNNNNALNFSLQYYQYNGTYVYDSIVVLGIYHNIIKTFLDSPMTEENKLLLLENACLKGNRLQFDLLINELNKFTNQCVLNCCASGSVDILKILLNMKALPTSDCIGYLQNNSMAIFTLLLENGLPVNINNIELAFNKGLYIENLSDYGFEPGMDLYELCYKLMIYPLTYIKQLMKNPAVNLDVRTEIMEYSAHNNNVRKSDEEIIKMIDSAGVTPDYMMYSDAVSRGSNRTRLVEYFETEWGLAPNFHTLVRIPDYNGRLNFLSRIIKNHNISESLLMTNSSKNPLMSVPPQVLEKDPTLKAGVKDKKTIVVKGKKKRQL